MSSTPEIEEGTPALVGLSPLGLQAVNMVSDLTGFNRRDSVERALIVYATMCKAKQRLDEHLPPETDPYEQMCLDGYRWRTRRPAWFAPRWRACR